MLQCPIIAALGELNAGKSSVVGSFLSPAGRKRIPRGLDEAQGTHRFVYWVPSKWLSDESLKASFFELLSAVHGNQREYLSQDPSEASAQYRSGRDDAERIQMPLIADDPALDDLGAAFLDCPDVQTKDRNGSPENVLDNPRLEFLSQAARICSAFLLIWERAKIRDQLLETVVANLRARMTAAPLYLLVNKIEPRADEPGATAEDPSLRRLRERYDIKEHDCYAAFHYRMAADGSNPGWEELTPPALVESFDATGRQFPQFFRMTIGDEAAEAHDKPPSLAQLPRSLDLADLQRRKLADSWRDLGAQVKRDLELVNTWSDSQRQRSHELHQGLLDFCVRQFTDPETGEPRQIATKDFTEALRASFVRTAPPVTRWSMSMSHRFESALTSTTRRLKSVLAWSRPAAKLRESRERLQGMLEEEGIFGASMLAPETLASEMHALRWAPVSVAPSELEAGWREALKNFYRYPLIHDEQKLDEMTRDVWKNLSAWQRIKVAARGLLLALGAVTALAGLVTVAVDAGATSLATYSLAATLAHAIPGIPVLVVGGAISGGATYAGFKMGALNLNTLPYLSRFFALACDAFGMPRRLGEQTLKATFGKGQDLKVFNLPEPRVDGQQCVCQLEALGLWQPGPAVQEIREVLRDG